MAKIRTLQSALNAGEISPLLMGRPDIQRYQHGLERCRNALPLAMGGATRRPGSRHIGQAAFSHFVRKIPFILSIDGELAGYVLELTPGKIRFYSAATLSRIEDGGLPVEVAVPYLYDELQEVRYAQHENILYLIHPAYPPKRLQRISDTSWSLENVPFVSVPFFRPAGTEETVMTPSAVSGIITVEASADFFEAEHVGHRMSINDGMMTITAVTDARTATAEVAGGIPDNEDGDLVIDDTTVTLTKADITGPTQVVIRSTAGAEAPLLTTISGDGPGAVATLVSTNNLYRVDETTIDIDPDLMAGDMVITIRSVSKYWNHILGTTGTGAAAGVAISIVRGLTQVTGAQPDKDWKVEAWTELYGYPSAIAFFEQRLLLAATPTLPATVWGSRTGKPLEFITGTLDDDPIALPVSAAKTTIYHLAAGDQVFMLTGEQELTLSGAADSPLTPTGFQIKGRTSSGSSESVRPLLLGNELLFCSASGENLHVLRYALERDGYIAPDLGAFADHLLTEGGGIMGMAYARRPTPSVWAYTAEGHLLCLVYDPTQEVYAWSRHDLGGDGKVRDVLVIPSAGKDRVWLTVERTIGGSSVTYIEVLDSDLNTDSAVTAADAGGKATWDGLDHLEGEEVDVVADGYVYPRQTVDGGEITLPDAVTAVEIGLHYQTTIKDLSPFLEGGAGAHLSCKKARVWLYASKGCSVNGERIPFRKFGDGLLDAPVAAFTGWKEITLGSGYSADGDTAQVEIVQDQPLPLTVLSIVKEVIANG